MDQRTRFDPKQTGQNGREIGHPKKNNRRTGKKNPSREWGEKKIMKGNKPTRRGPSGRQREVGRDKDENCRGEQQDFKAGVSQS